MTRTRATLALAGAAALLYTVLWIAWAAGWSWLARFDQALLGPPHAYGVDHPGWVTGWNIFSTVFGPEVLRAVVLVLIAVELIRRNRRPDGPRRVGFLLLTAAGSALLTELAKLADRPRPVTKLVDAHGMSFPSGHALGMLVIVGALLVSYLPMIAPRWHTAAIAAGAAVVLLIGVSRVVLNVHNPSDVLAGWALGYLYLLACVRWYPPRPDRELTPAAGTPPAPDTST